MHRDMPRATIDRPGSAAPRPSRSSPDDYERQELLGQGAFGKVYRVRRVRDGKVFACKEISPQSHNSTVIEQSVAEINALRNLKHPSIIRYVDRYYNPTSRAHCIVMELADGGDLGTVINEAKEARRDRGVYIPEDTIWAYFAQMILHRDLKPQNILLDSRGRLKLADFGLSKALGPRDLATTFCGTPMYMAPEQVKNQKYDYKSDLWALGCILYELCALVPAIQPANWNMITDTVLGLNKPPLPRCYSSALKSLIYRLLSQRREDRPSTQELLTMPQITVQLRSLEIVDMKELVDAERKKLERKAREQREKEAELATREANVAQEYSALQAAMAEAEAQMVVRQQRLESKELELTQADATWRIEKERLTKWEADLAEAQRGLDAQKQEFDTVKSEQQAWYEERRREWDANAPLAFKYVGREEMIRRKSTEVNERIKAIEARERACLQREAEMEKRLQQARSANKMDRLERRATTFGPLPDRAIPRPSSAGQEDTPAPSSPRRSRRASAAPSSRSPVPQQALQDLHLGERRHTPPGTDPAAYVDAEESDDTEDLQILLRRSRPSVPDDEIEPVGTVYPEASTPAKSKKGRPASMLARDFAGPTPSAPPPQSKLPPPRAALDDSDEPMESIDRTRWTYDTTQRGLLQTPRKSGALGAEMARAASRAAAGDVAAPATKPKKEWRPPDSPIKSDSSIWDSSLPSPYLKRQTRPASGEPEPIVLPPAAPRSTRSPSRASLTTFNQPLAQGTWGDRRR